MTLSLTQLQELIPGNQNTEAWWWALDKFLDGYEINTPQRVAAFLAQCAHESAGFTAIKENLNYRWQTLRRVFPKYFPTDELAQYYAGLPNKQEAIANRVYANRMGNGPENTGDGYRYCGRGLIQLTGANNYSRFAESVGMLVEEVPHYLETFEGAVHSACWFWHSAGLNELADEGDLLTITCRINGGTNGLSDRIAHYQHALDVLEA